MSGLIERELLFGNPVKAAPKVSPDGRRLAFLAPDEGVLNVWLADSPRPDAPARPLTHDRGRGIRSYFWACDGASLLYTQDKDGDENWHIHQVDLKTGTVRDLTPFEGSQAHPLATDPKFPHELLVTANDRDKRVHDVLRVDLRDGSFRRVCENPGDVIGWLADADFRVRGAKAQRPDGGSELRVREDESSPWRVAASWDADEQGGALGFSADGASLYVETSLGSDTTRLVLMRVADGAETPIFSDPRADLGGALFHPTDYSLQAVAVEPERLEWTVLDPALKDDFAALAAACPGDFEVVSRDDADTLWVVFYNNDRRPPCYYLYDRKSRRAEFLFSTRPGLEGRALGAMEAVSFPARDGLTLRGYLTLPPAGTQERRPLVVLVHGGPWARDRWGWHPEALWLADRGCAVLRVNFRGSTGYGKAFLHAGDREWGAKMQDDLTDAVRWAVARGAADPARVAIYGGSYGGYAALAGAAFTPGVYSCAVDIVGPSNLETLIRSIPPYWEPMRRIFDLRVGDVDKEPEFLRERSPLHAAGRISIPLLIAQGANDPRVKQAESEQIVSVLKEKGKEVEYMLFPDEGHGFARPENRLRFYAAAEAFLSRHLSTRAQG
ncbi:MAG: S9 family peptidase [Elusimicrobia bacterium]|nr:S9 family peptidase [Elusimicrobiota bacterium]